MTRGCTVAIQAEQESASPSFKLHPVNPALRINTYSGHLGRAEDINTKLCKPGVASAREAQAATTDTARRLVVAADDGCMLGKGDLFAGDTIQK